MNHVPVMRRAVAATIHVSRALALAATCAAAQAAIIEDFRFDDPAGTAVESAANSAAGGNHFDVDADLVAVTTNGSGQLDASLKANNALGTTYVDLSPDPASGSLYAVMALRYAFDAGSLDTQENEEIRIGLMAADPRSTLTTAELQIRREDDNTVSLFGNAVGSGSLDTSGATLGLAQAETMIAVLALGLDEARLQTSYSLDGGISFTTLSDGQLDPTRAVASMRLTLNNDLSQDQVLIDRVFLSDTNPFPGLVPNVQTVPLPAAAWLFLSALGGLGWIGRRRATALMAV